MYPELAQPGDVGDVLVGVQRPVLGDLDPQPSRREPGPLEHGSDPAGQVRPGELARGDVDRHKQVRERPGGGVAAGPLEDPLGDRAVGVAVLEHLQEDPRQQQPPGRVLPAQQRLVAEGRPTAQVDDRLVVQAELVEGDGRHELGPQGEVGQRLRAHIGVEDLPAPSSRGLRPVERRVCLGEQLRAGRGGRGDRDPDRQRGAHLFAPEPQRLPHRHEDPLGDHDGLGGTGQVLQDDDELVPTEAPRGVDLPQLTTDRGGQGNQQVVTDPVAQAVVDELEVVDVQEQDRDGPGVTTGAGQRLVQPVQQQLPVGQPREGVVQRPVPELLLHAFLLQHARLQLGVHPGVVDRKRGLDREHLQHGAVGLVGAHPVTRHVDAQHTEQCAVPAVQRGEQCVQRVPRVLAAVDRQVGHEEVEVAVDRLLGTAVEEAQAATGLGGGEQLGPVLARGLLALQGVAHVVRTREGHDVEATSLDDEVDDRDPEAELLDDRLGHLLQRQGEVQRCPQALGDVHQHASRPRGHRDDGGLHRRKIPSVRMFW